jgi:carbon storage regulator
LLILTRRVGESLRIGENITITVIKQSRGQVGLAIDAPSDIKILREELIGTPPKDGRKP